MLDTGPIPDGSTPASSLASTPTLPIPFAIGEVVWSAECDSHDERVVCPECAGTKCVTLVTGNGEQFSLACQVCDTHGYGDGYIGPTGFVNKETYDFRPKQFTCHRLSIYDNDIIYSDTSNYGHSSRSSTELFRDYNECLARCQEKKLESEKRDEQQVIANISSKRKHLAFSVHYWQCEVKELERKLEAAKARLNVSKEKEKKKLDK